MHVQMVDFLLSAHGVTILNGLSVSSSETEKRDNNLMSTHTSVERQEAIGGH
jgi:hypothetical protein